MELEGGEFSGRTNEINFAKSKSLFSMPIYCGGNNDRTPEGFFRSSNDVSDFWENFKKWGNICDIQNEIIKMCQTLFKGEEDQAGGFINVLKEKLDHSRPCSHSKEPALLKIERLTEEFIRQVSEGLVVFLINNDFRPSDVPKDENNLKKILVTPVLIAAMSYMFPAGITKGLTVNFVSDREGENTHGESSLYGQGTRLSGELTRKAFNRVFLKRLDDKVQKLFAKYGIPRGINCKYFFGRGLGIYLGISEDGTSNGDFHFSPSQRSQDFIPHVLKPIS